MFTPYVRTCCFGLTICYGTEVNLELVHQQFIIALLNLMFGCTSCFAFYYTSTVGYTDCYTLQRLFTVVINKHCYKLTNATDQHASQNFHFRKFWRALNYSSGTSDFCSVQQVFYKL